MQPRKPTEQEKHELLNYLIKVEAYGMGMITAEEVKKVFDDSVNIAPIVVFDDYKTDWGYHGKLMAEVNIGAGLTVNVFVWHRGKLTRIGGQRDIENILKQLK